MREAVGGIYPKSARDIYLTKDVHEDVGCMLRMGLGFCVVGGDREKKNIGRWRMGREMTLSLQGDLVRP
jgi:hypothetical protein